MKSTLTDSALGPRRIVVFKYLQCESGWVFWSNECARCHFTHRNETKFEQHVCKPTEDQEFRAGAALEMLNKWMQRSDK